MSVDARAIEKIKIILGPGGYIDDPAQMEKHLVAWRGGWRGTSPLVALPSTTMQVAEIIKVCAASRIPIVPQGGNTGTVGGCIPSADGNQIVIGLGRLNKIRMIDRAAAVATVEAGVILQNLQEEADKTGFLFPLSMGSQGSAQIGGAISTNAGGTAVLRYGNTRELVLGVEAVLPNGEIFSSLKGLRKDNMGYNLSQYLIGSEGTLGIVTAAALKLFPKPQQSLTAVAAVKDADAALSLLGDFRAKCGEYLSGFEIISEAAIKLSLKNIPGTRRPGETEAPYYILVQLDATSAAAPLRAAFEEAAAAALENGKMLDAVIAESTAQARQFWNLREHIPDAIRKEAAAIHFDIALPLAEIPDFLKKTSAAVRAAAPAIVIAPFGHIGDGNIHYNMCFAEAPEDFPAVKKRIQDIVYADVLKRGGSLSAEHGIGTARKEALRLARPAADIALMKAVKRAFDPDGIMNPNKIFD